MHWVLSQVLQQLRSTYSAGFGLPAYMTAAEQEAEDKRVWREYHAAQEAAQRQLEEEEAARQEVLRKHLPFQVRLTDMVDAQAPKRAHVGEALTLA